MDQYEASQHPPGVTGRAVFARTLQALKPYLDDIVLIGGWVHELYLREGGYSELPVRTDDIDFTLPKNLERAGRPSLIDLAIEAGFEIDRIGQAEQILRLAQSVERGMLDLDLLTEGLDPKTPVEIIGQPGLFAQGYPNQNILLENSRLIKVGPQVHPSLQPPVKIRVPTLSAYVLQKGNSAVHRTVLKKKAKDVVYLLEIVRHPSLGPEALAGIRPFAELYPNAYQVWRSCLDDVATGSAVRRAVAEQLLQSGGVWNGGMIEVMQQVTAWCRRVLGETPR